LAERTGQAGGTAHRQTPAPVLRLRSDAVRSGRWRQATHCAAFQALALGQPNHALSPLPRRARLPAGLDMSAPLNVVMKAFQPP